MLFVKRASIFTLLLVSAAALLVIGGFIWSGIYNIGADDAHSRPVYTLLQTMRDRSISTRARKLHPPPNLNDAARIRQGAGNYAAMCTGCHLAPGMKDTELSKGLYPTPPALAEVAVGNPAHHFLVIKHGIKASGMPAWGKSMEDEYIWGIVAFLQQLPKLEAAQYQALIATSGGHAHGGGETQTNADGRGMPDDHGDMQMEGMPTAEHKSHPAPQPTQADDGHDHEC